MEYIKTGEIKQMIEGKTITDCWTKLVEQIYLYGYNAVTPKDEGVGKELQHVLVKVPIKKPRTHPLYGGLAKREGQALDGYINQVVGEGSHDLGKESPFKYTYHQLLRHYGTEYPWEQGGYDQIKTLANLIIPFKRSYLASTWRVPKDNEGDITGGDQPCLMILWCWLGWNTEAFKEETQRMTEFYRTHRFSQAPIIKEGAGEKTPYHELVKEIDELLWCFYTDNRRFCPTVEMHCVWRNRDAGSAWLDNVCAMTVQQQEIAKIIETRIGIPVRPGYYYDYSIAIQVYPRDFENIKEVIGIKWK